MKARSAKTKPYNRFLGLSPKRRTALLFGALALVSFLIFLLTLQNPDQRRLQFYLSRTMTPDIEYCHGQKMDFYAPRQRTNRPSPVVLYIHGGGWLINNKQSDPDQMIRLDPLLDQNYAFASINYRSLPLHTFPAPVEDSLCAVRFLKANAKRFNIDSERIAVYGNSSGAHLAAMVGVLGHTTTFRTSEYENFSSSVRGVITIGGQMDFTRQVTAANKLRTAWFVARYKKEPAYPLVHVDTAAPPFLLVHGKQDESVKYQQAELMAGALYQKKIRHELLIVDRADHGLHPEGGIPIPAPDEINKRMQVFILKQMQ